MTKSVVKNATIREIDWTDKIFTYIRIWKTVLIKLFHLSFQDALSFFVASPEPKHVPVINTAEMWNIWAFAPQLQSDRNVTHNCGFMFTYSRALFAEYHATAIGLGKGVQTYTCVHLCWCATAMGLSEQECLNVKRLINAWWFFIKAPQSNYLNVNANNINLFCPVLHAVASLWKTAR